MANRIEEIRRAKKMSMEALALAIGTSAPTINKLEKGQMRLSDKWLGPIARALDVSPGALLGDNEEGAAPKQRSIPVYGMAAGAFAGAFTMTSDEVERVPAPPGLAHVRDAYALIVTGSSMEPRYFAGDTIFVNPHRPPRPGDHVIVQIRDHRPEGRQTFIKRYVGETHGAVVVSQYNPPMNTEWKREQVSLLHRVLTTNELLGV